MVITYSLPLNDAYWFLRQVEGLPNVPTSKQLTLRYLRATAVFSWVALEQMLNAVVDDYVAQGKVARLSVPERLRDKLEYVLAINGRHLIAHSSSNIVFSETKLRTASGSLHFRTFKLHSTFALTRLGLFILARCV